MLDGVVALSRSGIMTPNLSKGFDRSFSIRMKSTLTKRGVHVKTSGYRVVHILAHMRPQFSFSVNRKHPPHLIGIVGIALALPPPTISELRMENDTFVTRLGLDFTVSYCEPKISELMNISPDDLNNRSLYDFIHAEDLKRIRKSHVDLLSKGQVLTDYYRMLNKHGGYVWVQTCAMMILNKNDEVISTIIGVNTVLSGIEYSNCIMDTSQMKTVFTPDPDQSDHSENDSGSDQDPGKNGEKDTPSLEPSVVPHGTVASSSANRNGSRQASSTGKSHSSSHETQSPEAALEKISNTKEVDILSEDVFFEDSNKTDTRISRRKLDKPRKRKRSLADEIQSHLDKYSGTVQNNTRLDDENGAQGTEQMQKQDNDSSATEQYQMSSVASDMDQSPPLTNISTDGYAVRITFHAAFC
ncbi:protein trachealess-like [Lingula anatina]|uniref:Protein trachealess-like n=1 Tax=Lingula anatina TaxID=7574 RepID=A0A1S3J850_LINAN|nr:protein trachealess-like [Lingula anatina]|eukprot:XP_013406577.1 protein trachealess-like [Lingula anatina]